MLPSWIVIGCLTSRVFEQRTEKLGRGWCISNNFFFPLWPIVTRPNPPQHQIQDGSLTRKCALASPNYARIMDYLITCKCLACVRVCCTFNMEPYFFLWSYGIIVILVEGRKRASQTAKTSSIKKIDRGKYWPPEHKQSWQEDCIK